MLDGLWNNWIVSWRAFADDGSHDDGRNTARESSEHAPRLTKNFLGIIMKPEQPKRTLHVVENPNSRFAIYFL